MEDDQQDTLLNPTVLIEIVSASTHPDYRDKFLIHHRIESLQAYIMIYQDKPYIEHYTRKGDAWEWRITEGLDSVLEIAPVQCSMPLAQIYEGLDFDPIEEDDL